MEHGFFHAERGYWQTTDAPPAEILAAYPEGTVEVSIRPSADHQWQNGAWVYVAPPPQPVVVPDMVAKLALVRAMREVGLDGQPATGASIWDAVKVAISQAGGAVEEDWQLANHIPRNDPTINALAAQLVPTDPPREAILDALFLRAAELE